MIEIATGDQIMTARSSKRREAAAPAKPSYAGPYAPLSLVTGGPLVELVDVDCVPPQLALVRFGDVCARQGIETAEALARVICAAGSLTIYRGIGAELFTNPAAFGFAVDIAKRAGVI
jgi:hypothetical protein